MANEIIRHGFKLLVSRGNVPEKLFERNEKTGRYTWPGLEARYKDFETGALWHNEQMKKAITNGRLSHAEI